MTRKSARRAFESLIMLALPLTVHAQQSARTAVLYGSVLTDPNDRPVAGAEVIISPTLTARTDSSGSFILRGVPAGLQQVVVRHLGNRPITAVVNFPPGDSVGRDFVLEVDVASLDTVHVVEKPVMPTLSLMRMGEYDVHKKMGIGQFVDSAVFRRQQGRRVSDILRSYVTARVIDYGTSAAIATRSGDLGRFVTGLPFGDIFDFRRGSRRACYSQVFVDGMKVYEPEMGRSLFDINSLSPDMILGAEYYNGPAGTPAAYGGLGASCGTLLLWTRQ